MIRYTKLDIYENNTMKYFERLSLFKSKYKYQNVSIDELIEKFSFDKDIEEVFNTKIYFKNNNFQIHTFYNKDSEKILIDDTNKINYINYDHFIVMLTNDKFNDNILLPIFILFESDINDTNVSKFHIITLDILNKKDIFNTMKQYKGLFNKYISNFEMIEMKLK